MTHDIDFKQVVTTWLPPLAGVALIAMFLSLASWQLDRAAEKKELSDLFTDVAPVTRLEELSEPRLYQPVTVTGRYLPTRQVLLDNIIQGGRLGYYVVTPFVAEPDGRLLLVNRGWVPKLASDGNLPTVDVGAGRREITARVGRLPRVALRSEQPFGAGEDWPRVAVYPDADDISRAIARNISEPVLLLAPGVPDGFLRNWQPAEKGLMMHYGYAFQWSALALTVLIILVWHTGKRLRND